MKKFAFLTIGLLCSMSAFAVDTDFSSIGSSDMHLKHLSKCLKQGWEASNPTDTQKSDAQVLVEAARNVINSGKNVIKSDKQALITAWTSSPVVSQDVETAESKLRTDMLNVYNPVRDDMIKILNLLTPDQRKAFNTSFKSCHQSFESEDSNS